MSLVGASLLVGVCVCAVLVALLPSPLQPHEWKNATPLARLEGPYARNTLLSGAIHAGVGVLLAPEAIAFAADGRAFLSLADGHIAMVSAHGEFLEYLFFTGGFIGGNGSLNGLDYLGHRATCTSAAKAHKMFNTSLEESCGRPLGLRYKLENGVEHLYFLDSHHGLFKYDITRRTADMLFSSRNDSISVCGSDGATVDSISLAVPKFLNDLDIASDGTIYISDTSYIHTWSEKEQELLDGAPRGRLLKYTKDEGLCVFMCGLHFPNGLQLSQSGNLLYVAQTTRFRITAIDVKSFRHNPTDFVDALRRCDRGESLPKGARVAVASLPGVPDNIRSDGQGNILIGMGTLDVTPFSLIHLAYQPGLLWMRILMGKLLPTHLVVLFLPRYGLVGVMREAVESDGSPELMLASYQDPSGRTPFISHSAINPATQQLWLGSIANPFVGIATLPTKS